MSKLERYHDLLVAWQSRMNLVGPATLPDTWSRHFRDSAQLAPLTGGLSSGRWLDMGSGAGFPGLIVALLSDFAVELVEATAKKCAFLNAVVAECGIGNAIVHNARVEALTPFPADIISARACAPLDKLFGWGKRFARPDTVWILPKGSRYLAEVRDAERSFRFSWTPIPSRTDPDARILVAKLDLTDDG